MIKIESIVLTDKMIVNDGEFILVSVSPIYESEKIRIGTEVIVALTGRQFSKIVVTVHENVACSPFNTLEIKKVLFDEFLGGFSKNNSGDYVFSAQAKSFKLITDE